MFEARAIRYKIPLIEIPPCSGIHHGIRNCEKICDNLNEILHAHERGREDKAVLTLEECGKYFLSLKAKTSRNDSCCKQLLNNTHHQLE